jgi:hypothetical protein
MAYFYFMRMSKNGIGNCEKVGNCICAKEKRDEKENPGIIA